MTKTQELELLASNGQMCCINDQGQLVTVDGLLTHLWGRPVEPSEAVDYIRKQQFINNIKRLSHAKTT